ncbi:EAL domain-containing protein [Martelella alba]|uniref:EAL domain-containing protein n=1 Tax=Martelella alba TaxID=2590451 RepID=A0A506U9Z5_9HYPH|nr:GGDEF domain-containing phosphodiesterase [Martelella alba]TPW29409.1 EAL domain-containing protein [Martelella alba]
MAEQSKDLPRHTVNVKAFILLVTLFFVALGTGIFFADNFIRTTIEHSYRQQTLERLKGFSTALKSTIENIDRMGSVINQTLSLNPPAAKAAAKTYLTKVDWLETAILHDAQGQTSVVSNPQLDPAEQLTPAVSNGENRSISGPITLNDGRKVLVFHFRDGPVETDLVADLQELLGEVGLIEFESDFNFAIQADLLSAANKHLLISHSGIDDGSAVINGVDIAGNRWTLSASPKTGWGSTNDWRETIRIAMILVALSYLVPATLVFLLLHARARARRDINTNRREINALSQRLAVALEASNIGMWEQDMETGDQIWDERLQQIYGVTGSGERHSYADWLSRIHPEDRKLYEEVGFRGSSKQNGYQRQFRIITPDGKIKVMRSASNSFHDADGKLKIVGINWDVTADFMLQQELASSKATAEARNSELERARREMEDIALHDALTGIANRSHFERRLEELQKAGPLPRDATIMLIDLDGFKTINDTMGHFFGDEVLKYAADVFSHAIEPSDFLARTGGDEFVILMQHDGHANALAQQIISKFNMPVTIGRRACRIGASIGIARARDEGDTAGQLLIKADLALYEAKRRGRGQIAHYSEALMTETVETKLVADELLEALENGQIVPYYQPLFDAETGALAGVEALARWEHPEHGLLSPDRFLETAERIGTIKKVDLCIFERALADVAEWNATEMQVPAISVNISAQRLSDPELMHELSGRPKPKAELHFELLESIPFDQEDDELTETLNALRALGTAIDIDDFGSGYASLVGLLNVRPNRLKIARQLVQPILVSEERRRVVQTIIGIGRSLGIDVVAEGVESMAHAEMLRDLGCSKLQGHAFARAMSREDFTIYVTNKAWQKP